MLSTQETTPTGNVASKPEQTKPEQIKPEQAQPEQARSSAIVALSSRIATFEAYVAGVLIFLILALLLANVVFRTLGVPLIWADELAVLIMAWVAFVGASMGLAYGQHIAVTLFADAVSAAVRRRLALLVEILLLTFFAVLSVQLWNWFDPIGLWQAGSFEAFSTTTFNFIYQEPTITLGISKFWFWLVLPLFCVTSVVHILASFVTTLQSSGEDQL